MKMCILIKDLNFEAIIGILPEERQKPQKINISAKIKYRYKDSKDYLDYVKVANTIMECVQTKQYGLLEEALNDIAATCFKTFKKIKTLTLYIEKPDILQHCKVGMRAKFRRKNNGFTFMFAISRD